jgi:hypothetical protein
VQYRFADLNCGTWWNNHIAPTILTLNDGHTEVVVIDPEVANAPVSVGEWRRVQDAFGATCILTADWNGASTIDPRHSSEEVLWRVIEAVPSVGTEESVASLIEILTSGAISKGRIINPFNPPMVSGENGIPSIEATSAYFAEWLAPLATFRKWRAARVTDLTSAIQEIGK